MIALSQSYNIGLAKISFSIEIIYASPRGNCLQRQRMNELTFPRSSIPEQFEDIITYDVLDIIESGGSGDTIPYVDFYNRWCFDGSELLPHIAGRCLSFLFIFRVING